MPYFDFSVTKKQTNTNHKKQNNTQLLKEVYMELFIQQLQECYL